ncbi:MAG: prolipoprotein diacylglyceryl transferase, partial [Acidimicrobiia bacterium]|nr:prolipoprotein diacylglyceryl transferase [Acidimicrobiia bacterium]
EARRTGVNGEKVSMVAAGALIGGGIFAKISTAWQFVGDADSLANLYLYGGRSVLGGLAGAYLGAEVTKRIVGYRRSTGDLFAPAVAAAMAVGRVGCFLTEQVGTATSLPWGMTVSAEAAATIPNCPQCANGVAMHPSFLYEIAFHVVAFAVLWRNRGRLAEEGASFKLYLLGYGVFRFAVEFVRGNPIMAGGLTGSQIFLLITLPFLAAYVARRWRSGAYRLVAQGAPV